MTESKQTRGRVNSGSFVSSQDHGQIAKTLGGTATFHLNGSNAGYRLSTRKETI